MWVFKSTNQFLDDEDGAVSTDWIVLTAFCMGVCVAASLITGDSIADYGTEVGESISNRGIPTFGGGSNNKGLN